MEMMRMIKIPITNPISHPSMRVRESIRRDREGREDRKGREDSRHVEV
jgi:hypothetical protein